jgi:hypothetical protein
MNRLRETPRKDVVADFLIFAAITVALFAFS